MADRRICKECNANKPISEYRLRNTGTYRRSCRTCEREYFKARKRYIRTIDTEYDKRIYLKRREKVLRWHKENPQHSRYHSAKRRAMLAKATPVWADLDEIKCIYLNCPEGYEVDHIIPLNNENICGLHVPSNLQYLPMSENRRKSNKWPM